MKRWFRPLAYSIIAVLVVLAVWPVPPPQDDESVAAVVAPSVREPRDAPVASASAGPQLAPRAEAMLSARLFSAPATAAAAEEVIELPVLPELEPSEVIIEPKVVGWMQMGEVPYVFVEYAGAHHALAPGEEVDGVYQLEGVDDGYAQFKHLPTGQERLYPVSEPDAVEE